MFKLEAVVAVFCFMFFMKSTMKSIVLLCFYILEVVVKGRLQKKLSEEHSKEIVGHEAKIVVNKAVNRQLIG